MENDPGPCKRYRKRFVMNARLRAHRLAGGRSDWELKLAYEILS
jgi:hypothetical protein